MKNKKAKITVILIFLSSVFLILIVFRIVRGFVPAAGPSLQTPGAQTGGPPSGPPSGPPNGQNRGSGQGGQSGGGGQEGQRGGQNRQGDQG
ncbi:MAG: hypothetical protein LBH07_03160, partial [Treponema sp.]|nr:hypothetical protein [Treponema sp.]